MSGHFYDAGLTRFAQDLKKQEASISQQPRTPHLSVHQQAKRWISKCHAIGQARRSNSDIHVTPVLRQTSQCSSPVFHSAQYAT